MIRSLTFLGAVSLAAIPAAAQCPPTAVQDAVNLDAAVNQSSDLKSIGGQIDALAEACAADAYVQKVAALAHLHIQGRMTEPAKAFDHASQAWTYVMKMRDVQPGNERPVSAMAGNQRVPIQVFSNDDFDSQVLLNLFNIELKTGKLAPEHQPPKPGEALRPCRAHDPIEAQAASMIIRKNLKQDIPPAQNMLDRLVAICGKQMDKGINDRILALRASAYKELLRENPKRPNALALLEKAQADSARWLELNPGPASLAYWSKFEAEQLDELAVEVRVANGSLPVEADWFKPGNPENPLVIRAIADRLDDAWAVDEPLGLSGQYKTYRALINDLVYDRAMTSGNIPAAKRAVALAAKGHADGTYRKAANKALGTPPDFLWIWIDAEVKPNGGRR